jgi:hypothetical protein
MSSLGLLAEFSPDRRGQDLRRYARRRLRFESALASAAAPSQVLVLDLSEAGLMLHARDDLAVGEIFEVTLPAGHAPDTTAVEACVVWKRGPLYGCRFLSAVTGAMIAAVRLKAGTGRSVAHKPG